MTKPYLSVALVLFVLAGCADPRSPRGRSEVDMSLLSTGAALEQPAAQGQPMRPAGRELVAAAQRAHAAIGRVQTAIDNGAGAAEIERLQREAKPILDAFGDLHLADLRAQGYVVPASAFRRISIRSQTSLSFAFFRTEADERASEAFLVSSTRFLLRDGAVYDVVSVAIGDRR